MKRASHYTENFELTNLADWYWLAGSFLHKTKLPVLKIIAKLVFQTFLSFLVFSYYHLVQNNIFIKLFVLLGKPCSRNVTSFLRFRLRNEESIFWKLSEKADFWKEKLYTCKRKYSVTSIPLPHEHIRVTLTLTLSEFMLRYMTLLLSGTWQKV